MKKIIALIGVLSISMTVQAELVNKCTLFISYSSGEQTVELDKAAVTDNQRVLLGLDATRMATGTMVEMSTVAANLKTAGVCEIVTIERLNY